MTLDEALAVLEDSDYKLYPAIHEMRTSLSGRIRRTIIDDERVSYSYENELISIPLGTVIQGSEYEEALEKRAREFYDWVIYLAEAKGEQLY